MLEDAMRDYLDAKARGRPRRHVLEALGASLEDFDALYRELAK